MSDDIIARAEAALEGISPGPWKIRFNGHWAHVVMTPNGCVWNPDTGKVNDRRNGEFIAAARQLVPELVAELKTTREFRYKVADAVGFVECVESVGNAILADDNTILDYVRAHAETARKHETECPVWCEAHEHFEHVDSCKECGGSGCGPGTATGAHEGCDECGGDGRDHDFAYVHAPDVEAELKTTRAQLETLRAGLTRVEHFARIQALSERVRTGPAHSTYHCEERHWLDLLALIERAEVADV